jgi:hypothetical protein
MEQYFPIQIEQDRGTYQPQLKPGSQVFQNSELTLIWDDTTSHNPTSIECHSPLVLPKDLCCNPQYLVVFFSTALLGFERTNFAFV